MTPLLTGLSIPLSIPSPSEGVWYLGPLPLRAYALAIILGVFAAVWTGEKRWVARGGTRGQIGDLALWAVPAGLIGARLWHVATDYRAVLRRGRRRPDRRAEDLAGRPGDLGRDHGRPVGGVVLLPPPRHPAPAARRRPGPVPAARADPRSLRQLLQPGAVRAAHRPALGPRDRHGAPAVRLRAVHDVPSHVPLRGAVEPRRDRGAALGRPTVPARLRPGVRRST